MNDETDDEVTAEDETDEVTPRVRRAVLDPPTTRKSDAEIIADGKKAWKRIQRNAPKMWDDWLKIAEALDRGRDHALNVSGAIEPRGKRYNTEFSDWLYMNDFDDIHETTRAHLLKIQDNWIEVYDWRDTLTDRERADFNHPVTVWGKFQAHLRAEGLRDVKPRKPGLREANMQLQSENDTLNQQNEALRQEMDAGGVAERDSIAAIIEAVNRRFENDDLVDLIDGLITMAHARGIDKTWGRRRATLHVVEPEGDDEPA